MAVSIVRSDVESGSSSQTVPQPIRQRFGAESDHPLFNVPRSDAWQKPSLTTQTFFWVKSANLVVRLAARRTLGKRGRSLPDHLEVQLAERFPTREQRVFPYQAVKKIASSVIFDYHD